jgi:hypothetical protein
MIIQTTKRDAPPAWKVFRAQGPCCFPFGFATTVRACHTLEDFVFNEEFDGFTFIIENVCKHVARRDVTIKRRTCVMSWNVPIAHETTNAQHHGEHKEGCDEHAHNNGVVHNLLVTMDNHGVKTKWEQFFEQDVLYG